MNVNVEIRQYSGEEAEIRGHTDFQLSACEFCEEVAPAAVPKQEHFLSLSLFASVRVSGLLQMIDAETRRERLGGRILTDLKNE